MKFEDLTVEQLKNHARGNVKGYTAMKKDQLVKHLKKGFKLMKGGNLVAKEPKGRTVSGGRCWDGYEPVEGKKPYSEGSCKKVEGSGLEDSRKRLKEALASHVQMLRAFQSVKPTPVEGGQLPCGITEKLKDLQMKGSGMQPQAPAPQVTPQAWENAPNFKAQYEQANGAGMYKDLASFADHILTDKDKYQAKTVKRARFYKNVLQKKKST